MDMGSLLTCTVVSYKSGMSFVFRVRNVKGGGTRYHFSSSYSESGVLSLNFHLDRERPCFSPTANLTALPGKRAPTPPPNSSKAHRVHVYAIYYGAQDAGFSADWCACISVCRELQKCILEAYFFARNYGLCYYKIIQQPQHHWHDTHVH